MKDTDPERYPSNIEKNITNLNPKMLDDFSLYSDGDQKYLCLKSSDHANDRLNANRLLCWFLVRDLSK
ncbi:TPA: hypothetical protein DCW61_00790 [Candidatus Uhrbacteria bacterium]|nr:hypothetical protein [Candidatus Uhrbacteria bacterium]